MPKPWHEHYRVQLLRNRCVRRSQRVQHLYFSVMKFQGSRMDPPCRPVFQGQDLLHWRPICLPPAKPLPKVIDI